MRTREVADRPGVAALVATCDRPRADRACPLLAAIEADAPLTDVTLTQVSR